MDRGTSVRASVSAELLSRASEVSGVPASEVVDHALRMLVADQAMRELAAMKGVGGVGPVPPRRRGAGAPLAKKRKKGSKRAK